MLDRLRRDHPDVVLQTDETNDYRLFPFESTLRGPTWLQNGYPDVPSLLHNLWLLGPYVQSYSIGQHVLGGDSWKTNDVNTLMAAALPGAITFWTDLRRLPAPVIDTAARWVAFYRSHRDSFSLATYALLGDPLGRDIRRVALHHLPAGRRFTLRIEVFAANGAETISVRRYTGCKKKRHRRPPSDRDIG